MAQDTLFLLQSLGWTENVYLGGVSMGGMISLELLLLAPQSTFAGAALISTTAKVTLPSFKFIRLQVWNMIFGRNTDQNGVINEIMDIVFGQSWLQKRRNSETDSDDDVIITNRDFCREVNSALYSFFF